MKNHGVKPVLLSRGQIEALQRIQAEKRQKGAVIAPFLHTHNAFPFRIKLFFIVYA